jgi:hypothetical protein
MQQQQKALTGVPVAPASTSTSTSTTQAQMLASIALPLIPVVPRTAEPFSSTFTAPRAVKTPSSLVVCLQKFSSKQNTRTLQLGVAEEPIKQNMKGFLI